MKERKKRISGREVIAEIDDLLGWVRFEKERGRDNVAEGYKTSIMNILLPALEAGAVKIVEVKSAKARRRQNFRGGNV